MAEKEEEMKMGAAKGGRRGSKPNIVECVEDRTGGKSVVGGLRDPALANLMPVRSGSSRKSDTQWLWRQIWRAGDVESGWVAFRGAGSEFG